MKIKFCPDLTGKEEVKAALIGHTTETNSLCSREQVMRLKKLQTK